MKKNKNAFPLSDYGFSEQSYVYTLCEERRDWRKFIEKHITLAKEEIMGKDEEGHLVSVSKAESDIKEHVTNSENAIKEHVTESENTIKQHTTEKTSLIISAINDLKSWWSTFRPSWA